MKEQQATEKINFWNIVVRIFQGTIIGLASMVPFFQVKDLKEAIGFREDRFTNNVSFPERISWLFLHRWGYMLGIIIGATIFFFIPCLNLVNDYPYTIYFGLLALCLPFLALEIYRFVYARKNLYHWIVTASLFSTILIFIPCCYFFFPMIWNNISVTPEWFSSWGLILVPLLFAVGTFLACFSGISAGTIIFCSTTMISFAKAANTFLYSFNNVFLPVLALFGATLGYYGFVFLNSYFPKSQMEKHGINIAFYGSGIIILVIKTILMFAQGTSFFTDISSDKAQIVTFVSVLMSCLFVAVGLTIHGYRFLNPKDFDELNDTFKDYKRI